MNLAREVNYSCIFSGNLSIVWYTQAFLKTSKQFIKYKLVIYLFSHTNRITCININDNNNINYNRNVYIYV